MKNSNLGAAAHSDPLVPIPIVNEWVISELYMEYVLTVGMTIISIGGFSIDNIIIKPSLIVSINLSCL